MSVLLLAEALSPEQKPTLINFFSVREAFLFFICFHPRCLQVASAVSSAADAVASAAEAVGAAFVHAGEGIGEVVSRPVEYLKAHVPAVRHTSEGIASGIASGSQHMADFMERTGENLRPVTDGANRLHLRRWMC